MSTSVMPRHAPPPVFEPSTDFPTYEDEEPVERSRAWIVALVVLAALLLGVVGFVAGRATAPASPPVACVEALQSADAAFTAALAELGTIEAGALSVIDGELGEADSVLQGARLGQAEIVRLRSSFEAAAAICRAG